MMKMHTVHTQHAHTHGPRCGHTAIAHEGHVDYLHDGCLHSAHLGHTDEHAIAISKINTDACTPAHACAGHDAAHVHGPSCGHEAVPHGDHLDYLVGNHLHHACEGHCDDHGPITLA